MTLQRSVSPIPPGRYWLDVLGVARIAEFDKWLRDMHGSVVVEASELDREAEPVHAFIVFRVPEGRTPFLDARRFGFPNVADASVTSSRDVTQNEPTPSPVDSAIDAARAAGKSAVALAPIVPLVVLLLIVWAVSEHLSQRRAA